MKVMIESTSEIVELVVNGATVPARLWQGHTDSGIAVQVLVTRIAAGKGENLAQFELELKEQAPPESGPRAFPLRMIL